MYSDPFYPPPLENFEAFFRLNVFLLRTILGNIFIYFCVLIFIIQKMLFVRCQKQL